MKAKRRRGEVESERGGEEEKKNKKVRRNDPVYIRLKKIVSMFSRGKRPDGKEAREREERKKK